MTYEYYLDWELAVPVTTQCVCYGCWNEALRYDGENLGYCILHDDQDQEGLW